MVSEQSSLRPTSTESAMANESDDDVTVLKFAPGSKLHLSNLKEIIAEHFNLSHVQVIRVENGGVLLTGLFDGIPNDVESQNHESFDEINKLLGWIEGCIELPERSKSVSPKVFDESPKAMEKSLDQPIHNEFEVTQANSYQISSKEVPTSNVHKVLDEISKCDVLKEKDLLTKVAMNVDNVVKSDEEIAQMELNDELILMKELSDIVALQVFDKLPRMMSNHEIKFDGPMLSRVASFGTVVNEPNLLHSKFSSDKVHSNVQKLVAETYAFDSIVGPKLYYFDPGGKNSCLVDFLISNESKLVADFVNLKSTDPKKYSDSRCTNELTSMTSLFRVVILEFVVNQSDLLASEFDHAKVNLITAQEKNDKWLYKNLCFDPGGEEIDLVIDLAFVNSLSILLVSLGGEHDKLTAFENIENDYGRMICFDPRGVKVSLGATYFDSQCISMKSSDRADVIVLNLLFTHGDNNVPTENLDELNSISLPRAATFGFVEGQSTLQTSKCELASAQVVKGSCLVMLIFDYGGVDLKHTTRIVALMLASLGNMEAHLLGPLVLNCEENEKLLGPSGGSYSGSQQLTFDPGITFGQYNLKAHEVSKFVGYEGSLTSLIIKKAFTDAGNLVLAFKLIFVDKAEFHLGNGDTSIESIIILEVYESRTGIPLAEISALKPKLLELTGQTHLLGAYSFEIIVNQLDPLALEFDHTEILQLIESSVCKETKKSLQQNYCAAETDLKPLEKFNHYYATTAGFLTDYDLKKLEITWSSTHHCGGGEFLMQIKVVGTIFIYIGLLNLILLALSIPLNLSKYPLVKRLILNVFVKRALISASYPIGLLMQFSKEGNLGVLKSTSLLIYYVARLAILYHWSWIVSENNTNVSSLTGGMSFDSCILYSLDSLLVALDTFGLVEVGSTRFIFDPGGECSKVTSKAHHARFQGRLPNSYLCLTVLVVRCAFRPVIFIFDPGGECSRFLGKALHESLLKIIQSMEFFMILIYSRCKHLILEDKDLSKEGVLIQEFRNLVLNSLINISRFVPVL